METLDQTAWDVVIAGTGVQESLLALALSRSDKKILHVDKNDYYGGSEAALSLQDADDWVKSISNGNTHFSHASISQPSHPNGGDAEPKLSFPRAYSLALAPQLLYARSPLIPTLVSARVDKQLDFAAVSNWWIYQQSDSPTFVKVPNGREDLFEDQGLDQRTKRALMKFLRFVAHYEDQEEVWQPQADAPLEQFLKSKFNLSLDVQLPILSLVMKSGSTKSTSTRIALPRIALHLRSIGFLGAGFGAVIPKWGGLSELTQVGCRANAVGGAVYVLKNGLQDVSPAVSDSSKEQQRALQIKLSSGDVVTSDILVTGADNVPTRLQSVQTIESSMRVWRSISIVASPLKKLFVVRTEGAPTPAGAVAIVPIGAGDDMKLVNIVIHSSDSGECPNGQCVLYSSLEGPDESCFSALDSAIDTLLSQFGEGSTGTILWLLRYAQQTYSQDFTPELSSLKLNGAEDSTIVFPPLSADSVFDNHTLQLVREAWEKVTQGQGGEFLSFPPRSDIDDDE